MTWGHAVSDDLIHWRQLEHAMFPDEHGTMFSWSAVVDHEDTAGFGAGAIVFLYTAAGRHVDPPREFTQCLAWSTDNGMTLTKYEGNPVLGWIEGDNRDPKISWHAASRQWIMPLFLADDRFTLYGSKDLKSWTHLQDLRLEGDIRHTDTSSDIGASPAWRCLSAMMMNNQDGILSTNCWASTKRCWERLSMKDQKLVQPSWRGSRLFWKVLARRALRTMCHSGSY